LKPLESFYEAKGARDGRRGDCKACSAARAHERYVKNRERAIAQVKKWQQENAERVRGYRKRRNAEHPEIAREGHLRRKFGLTIAAYEELLAAQGGGCAICGDEVEGSLHVDHDHVTGKVRGLLCVRCNNALGQFQEDPVVLMRALAYLVSSEQRDDTLRERARALKVA
jgi:hypothetical protein